MGTSFTTAHIHNKQNLTKAQFKKAFTDMMKAKGYTASDEENAALTYTLVFAPDRKWITILTDGTDTRREAAELAKGLKSYAVMIDLVDSDFAELSLFDEAGAHKDTLTLGDSYLEDAAPMGSPAAWQPLLRGSWEQVQEIQNGSYTFAEDALVQFATLIGMDRGNILLDNDSADDNAVVLHFKKAAEKKLTLNSAFIKVFGEALEPLGFVKVKSKYPYFVRLINDEILQIISYRQIASRLRNVQSYEIYGGIATLYRRRIDFEERPEIWLKNLGAFYSVLTPEQDIDKELLGSLLHFNYSTDNSELAMETIRYSLKCTFKYIVEYFNGISSLSCCINFFYDFSYHMKLAEYDEFLSNNYFETSEGLILILDNYQGDCHKWVEKDIKLRTEITNDPNEISAIRQWCENENQKQIELRDKILGNNGIKKQYTSLANSYKENNRSELKKLFL